MKRIYLNKEGTIIFTKCRTDSDFQKCSYCGKIIGQGTIALSIVKKCTTRLNTYIHLNCIESFSKDIIKFKKDNIKYLIGQQLDKLKNEEE